MPSSVGPPGVGAVGPTDTGEILYADPIRGDSFVLEREDDELSLGSTGVEVGVVVGVDVVCRAR